MTLSLTNVSSISGGPVTIDSLLTQTQLGISLSNISMLGGFTSHITVPGSYPYTCIASDYIVAASSSSAHQINLPATPTLGNTFIIKDATDMAATNNITVSGNGNNIDGSSTYVLKSNGQSAVFVYGATQWGVLGDSGAITLPLSLANGGTGAALTASNGGIFYSTASAGAILSGTATANQVLLSGSSTTPAWSTATYPATTTINQLLYSSSNNVVGQVTAANNGVLISGTTGIPSWLAAGTTGQLLTATTSNPASWGISYSTTPTASTISEWDASRNMSANNFLLPTTTSSVGSLEINSVKFLQAYGTQNLFLGAATGNFTLTTGNAVNTTGCGYNVLQGLTTGAGNNMFGSLSGQQISSSSNNAGLGTQALTALTTGSGLNTSIGHATLYQLATGAYNTVVGGNSGGNYTTSESSNIIIGSEIGGTAAESHVLRVGSGTGTSAGNLNKAFICGINGITASNPLLTTINSSTDQLGVVATGNYGVLISSSAGVPSWLANGTTGQVLTATTSGTASWSTPPQVSYVNVTGASQTMAVNTGYVTNDASSLVTYTPPAACAVGTVFSIVGNSSNGWSVNLSTNTQTMNFGSAPGTTALASSNRYDGVTFICTVANTTFSVISSIGNLSIS